MVVRHPMPYGDLRREVVQRFASFEDFSRQRLTIEEREEYEPLVDQGIVVYAGIDYRQILAQAEQEAEVIVWDGGNNDTPFFKPDIHVVLFDPLRPQHGRLIFPRRDQSADGRHCHHQQGGRRRSRSISR